MYIVPDNNYCIKDAEKTAVLFSELPDAMQNFTGGNIQ
jgi:hypothetical protein